MPGLMPTSSTRTPGLTRSRSGCRMAAMNWLFKEEPANYSFDAFAHDKKAVWSGVRDPLAQKHLHALKKGARVFFYHTGSERSIVGVAKALTDAYPDPAEPVGKAAVVD